MILLTFTLGFIAGLLVSVIVIAIAFLRVPRLPMPPIITIDNETATIPPTWTIDEWAMMGSEMVQ